MKYKIIGDIHSRHELLKQALIDNPCHNLIFLGDILDGRNNLSPENKTKADLATLALLHQFPHTLIAGNHDLGLLDPQSNLTKDTVFRLKDYFAFNQFKTQIRQAPTFLKLIHNEIEYHLAHAYPFSTASKKEQSHGLKVDGRRLKWYENYNQNAVKICGHYHEIFTGPNAWVLDGDSKINCLPVLLLEDTVKLIQYS
jgi:predicted phosphodiesterase